MEGQEDRMNEREIRERKGRREREREREGGRGRGDTFDHIDKEKSRKWMKGDRKCYSLERLMLKGRLEYNPLFMHQRPY